MLNRIIMPALLASAALVASPAAAVIVTSVAGAPDPGIASPFLMVATFDAPLAAGITQTLTGTAIIAAGSTTGLRAAPAGTPTGGVYLSLGASSSATYNFAGYIPTNKKLSGISFYWGSIDSFNFVDFLRADGSLIQTVGGNQLPQFTGNQTSAITNRRVTFAFNSLEAVSKVRLRSTTSAAFELDSIAASIGPIPEPGTWLTMIVGFGMVGAAARQRRGAVAV